LSLSEFLLSNFLMNHFWVF